MTSMDDLVCRVDNVIDATEMLIYALSFGFEKEKAIGCCYVIADSLHVFSAALAKIGPYIRESPSESTK